MNFDSWDRLERVFFGALECPEAERATFLDEACGDDAAFRAEVNAVLLAHLTVPGEAESLSGGPEIPSMEGVRLGAYELRERVGSGGMAEVYRAARVDHQYHQDVAIKLVRSSLPVDEMARRFRLERQVLASLQHPNIAPLLDGGVAPDGRPYLVMQYVQGMAITEFADARRLSVAERLRLFATVCRTVQFAHANLVVHRDLKPSNILVTPDGVVQLLDFGIAKLLDPAGANITVPLTEELVLLTPEHAAPEQVLGNPITTATDVYSLGILLYELLTGTRPFRSSNPVELHRAVCEREPTRPSAALTTVAAQAPELDAALVAEARGLQALGLQQTLRGDLDQIVLMALRKEPPRRYASADQFAEDIERYLAGRPVIAQRDTLRYRSSKFLRRNRLTVGLAAALLLLVVSSAATVLYQSRERGRALVEAQRERDTSAQLSAFLVSIFDASTPGESRGETVTARELLDRAAARLDRDLETEPEVQADLALAMGEAYGGLGLVEPAQALVERAVQQRRASAGENPIPLANALRRLGRIRATAGALPEGMELMGEAVAILEERAGPNDSALAVTLTTLGRMQVSAGDYEGAHALLDRAERIQRAATPVDGRELARTLRFQFLVSEALGEPPEEWLAYTEEALRVGQADVDEDDPFLFELREDYALTLQGVGLGDSAVAMHERVLADRERVFGRDHPNVAFSYYNLGRAMGQLQGRWEESIPVLERALEIRQAAYGPDHLQVGIVLGRLATAHAFSGDLDAAVSISARGVRILETSIGERNRDTLDQLHVLAQLQSASGRSEAAFSSLETLLDRGWANLDILAAPTFDNIRSDARFEQILARARSGA